MGRAAWARGNGKTKEGRRKKEETAADFAERAARRYRIVTADLTTAFLPRSTLQSANH